MAITKLGASVLDRPFVYLGRRFGPWLTQPETLRRLGRAVELPYRMAKPLVRGGLRAAKAVGTLTGEHPGVMIPGLLGVGTAVAGAKSQLNKNLVHVDPQYDLTRQSLLGPGIVYKNPADKAYFDQQNLIY